jgi:hypothetical protein
MILHSLLCRLAVLPGKCLNICLSICLIACASQTAKVIFYPDPAQEKQQEQTGLHESWQIIESQNGPPEAGIPEWARLYLDDGLRGVEALDAYRGKYVFVGENQGSTLTGLQQWADGFAAAQDLPRLIAQRVEQRFVASAVLYPDDEYGEYFENAIKKISDAEYPGAVKEQTFWIKRQRYIEENTGEYTDDDFDTPQIDIDFEHYIFLILISIDKETLQKKIQELITSIKTNTAPTKEQTQAINKIRAHFFEGF